MEGKCTVGAKLPVVVRLVADQVRRKVDIRSSVDQGEAGNLGAESIHLLCGVELLRKMSPELCWPHNV